MTMDTSYHGISNGVLRSNRAPGACNKEARYQKLEHRLSAIWLGASVTASRDSPRLLRLEAPERHIEEALDQLTPGVGRGARKAIDLSCLPHHAFAQALDFFALLFFRAKMG